LSGEYSKQTKKRAGPLNPQFPTTLILNQLDDLELSDDLNIGDKAARYLFLCLGFIAGLFIRDCGVSDALAMKITSEHERLRSTTPVSSWVIGCQSCIACR